MPFARCRWYEDDGSPIKNGCHRIGSGCEFIHPNEASWNAAPPPRARTGDKPFHGRKNGSEVPTTGTNPSAVDSGWGNRRGRGRGRGGVPTAPRTPRTDPSDIGGGVSSGGGPGWGTVDVSSSTPSGWATINTSNTSSTSMAWDTVDTTSTAGGWGNADTTSTVAGWGSASGGEAEEPAASSSNNATGDWGAATGTVSASGGWGNGYSSGWGAPTSSSTAEGWGTENSSGPSGATAPGGWGSTSTGDKSAVGGWNTEPNENPLTWGTSTSNSSGWGTNATTSSPQAIQQDLAWGTDSASASTGKGKGKERETTGWANPGTDGDWVMEEVNTVITSVNDITALPNVVLSPLHTPEDIGTTKLPPTPRKEDIEITPLDLVAVMENLPDCILDTDSGDPYMQYIKTFVKSVMHYHDYEIAKADLLKHKKLRGVPRNTHLGPRGQEILDVVENADTARCENGKKNRDDAVRRLQELTALMNSSSTVMTDEEITEVERYAAQAKDWLQKVRNAVEKRDAVITQDVETTTVWDKLIQSMDDFEERLSNLYRLHDDIREHSQGDVMESIGTLIVKKVVDTHQADITRIRHEVDSVRARDIEEHQSSELDTIRAEQEAYRRSIAELEASFSKAEVDLNELLDGAVTATRNLEVLQIPTQTSPVSLIRFEDLAREIAANEFNFVSTKLKEAVRERLEADGRHITDTAWRQLQPMMQFTIRVSQALDKAKEAEGVNSAPQPTVTPPS